VVKFIENHGRKRLKWWGKMPPEPLHNYIVGCDISMGTGSSHSVASIYDVNTREKVGSWLCSLTEPKNFAEQAVALCYWLGGQNKPFLIWEANGGQGLIFERRITELGYTNIYYQANERIAHRPETFKKGWHSSQSSKLDMLSLYRNALYCRYTSSEHGYINYDVDSLRQCEDYVYLNASGSVGPSGFRDCDDGAKATHGDMVIADALCVLARNDQPEAVIKEEQKIIKGSMAMRDMIHNMEIRDIDNAHWMN
jgi:hypothetical protein